MIIGLSGKKQHGKDTVASMIQFLLWEKAMIEQGLQFFKDGPHSSTDPLFHYGIFAKWDKQTRSAYSNWTTIAFADKLKDIVCLLLNCTREQLEDNNFKEKELGEEWKVWFWTHYKFPSPRMSKLFITEQEAIDYRIEGRAIPECFGTASRISSCMLTPRLLLQLIGTDCGRNIIHPNIWTNSTLSNYKPLGEFRDNKWLIKRQGAAEKRDGKYFTPPIKSLPKEKHGIEINSPFFLWYESRDTPLYPDWIITDVRFPNEVSAIEKEEGIIIRINRPNMPKGDTHASETSLDNHPFNSTLNNDGDILTLFDKVKKLLVELELL